MIVYTPKPNFVPIAISDCKLNCLHCMGRYLKQMLQIYEAEKLLEFGKNYRGKGFLISGGFDRKARLINLEKMLPAIERLSNKFYVAIHPGFLNEDMAAKVAGACHIAFVDLPGENAIKNVFHLNASPYDYFHIMEMLLERGARVSPHITAGLNFGKIEEWEILDELKGYKVEKVVLNFILPTAGTPFENVDINVDEAVEFIKEAMKKFRHIALGCMRPRKLDISLIKAGIKEIANPSKEAMKYILQKGIKFERRNYCCGIRDFDIRKNACNQGNE